MSSSVTVGSLFAGIGGFDRGFERAGLQTAWQVESDRQCQRVLAKHFPHAERFHDVNDVGRDTLSPVDVICGGFPCQDLSVAGARKGLAGERSGLFFQFARIVGELRPELVIFENVPGLLSSDGGRDAAMVLRVFADLDFHGGWRVLDSQYFGVAQRRDRVFGCFARGRAGAGRAAEILALTESGLRHPQTRGEAEQAVAATIRGRSSSRGVSAPGRGGEDDSNLVISNAFTLKSVHRGIDNGWQGNYPADGRGVRRLMPVECLRLQGFADDWLDLSPPLSDSAKYKMTGNAVTATVAEWLGRRIVTAFRKVGAA